MGVEGWQAWLNSTCDISLCRGPFFLPMACRTYDWAVAFDAVGHGSKGTWIGYRTVHTHGLTASMI